MQQSRYFHSLKTSIFPVKLVKIWSCLIVVFFILSNCTKKDAPVAPLKTISTAYTLSANETWSGIVELQNVISVPAGKTLTIEAGTKIKVSDKAEFDIDGSLIIKGTASDIVRFYSIDANAKSGVWDGISFSGERLEVSYCAISDADQGLFLFSLATAKTITVDHCLFTNCDTGITDFSIGNTVVLTNNTFLSNYFEGYDQWGENKKVTIDASVFDSNGFGAIELLANNANSPKLTTVGVTKSNFLKESSYGFITTSSTFPPLNTALTLSGCYGLKTSYVVGTQKGNSISITSSVSSPISNIGCGFSLSRTGRLAAPAVSAEMALQLVREHHERAILKNKAHLSNL